VPNFQVVDNLAIGDTIGDARTTDYQPYISGDIQQLKSD
jgi:hypothetical protein